MIVIYAYELQVRHAGAALQKTTHAENGANTPNVVIITSSWSHLWVDGSHYWL